MEQNEPIVFKHSCNAGDAIYALAGIKAMCFRENKKAVFLQALNVKGSYYQGAVHPLGDKMMTGAMWSMFAPLIEVQSYIQEVTSFKGQPYHMNLDLIRQDKIGMPNGDISRWYQYTFPDMYCDPYHAWIDAPDEDSPATNSIIVNLTERYRNNWISYQFLQHNFKDYHVLFAGTEKEYLMFKEQVPRAMKLNVENFLQLAIAIKKCKIFIGNQSMCFAIAEGMKTPRMLEICSYAPNVLPQGGYYRDFYKQKALEQYLSEYLAEKE